MKLQKIIYEIVHVEVGHCTNLSGNAVCDALGADGKFTTNKHDADNQQRLDKIDVSFKEAGELRLVTHAALINSELGSLDAITASNWYNG